MDFLNPSLESFTEHHARASCPRRRATGHVAPATQQRNGWGSQCQRYLLRYLPTGHLGVCFTTQRHVKFILGPCTYSSFGILCCMYFWHIPSIVIRSPEASWIL